MDHGQGDNEGMDLGTWSRDLEEVLSWLLEAEDHLVAVNSLGQKHLETVKTRFYDHEDFMLELKTHQSTVGEVSCLHCIGIGVNFEVSTFVISGSQCRETSHDGQVRS